MNGYLSIARVATLTLLGSLLTLACSGAGVAEAPEFSREIFQEARRIELVDPLGVALGALGRGEPLVYSYGDAVKLAGHSCPAVAGGFKLVEIALAELYPDEIPERGGIEVRVLGAEGYKVNGPVSQIVGLVTGAASSSGFAGLGEGKFSRRDLLRFDAADPPAAGCVFSAVFRRADTGARVKVTYSNHMLESPEEMRRLMPLALSDGATDDELDRFGELWHERIEQILLAPPEGMFIVETL